MKIALLGDVHFGARNDHPSFDKYFEKFYTETFFPYLEKHNIKHIIQLGDVFDRRKYINFQTLQNCKRYFFDKLKPYQCWFLVGNHDTYYKNTVTTNSLELLLKQYNFNIIVDPYETSFEGVIFLFVPWICDSNQQAIMDALNTTKAHILVGHFEIDGFEMQRGLLHQGDFKQSMVSSFEYVFTGHFHHKSQRNNVYYLGTPYEITWADVDDPKGFHIFDTITRELIFVENPHKLFVKSLYDDQDPTTQDIDFALFKEKYIKLILRNKSNPFLFDLYVDKLEKAGAYNVQVVDDHFHMDTITDSEIVSEAESTLSILTKHIHHLDHVVDKHELEKVMVSLYEEALSVE